MKILITRSVEQGKETAKKFSKIKAEILLEPLVSIKNMKLSAQEKAKIKAAKALIFTSSNAVKSLASQVKNRNIKTIAVGDKTASELKNIGFSKVNSAKGSLEKLKQYIATEKGPLIYLSGNVVTEKLEEVFPGKVTRLEIYTSKYKKNFSKKLLQELENGQITQALFYSEQTALVFLNLLKQHKVVDKARNISVLCLSSRIAKTFKNQGFNMVKSSNTPSEKTLLGMLKEFS